MSNNFEINTDWKTEEYQWRRNVSDKYNERWEEPFGLIEPETFLSIEYPSTHQVVWLKNIDRLMDKTPIMFQPDQYSLIDAGCGGGISTLYFTDNYPFKNFIGFDPSEKMIQLSEQNLNKYLAIRNKESREIKFIMSDAVNYLLPDNPNFIFMANPFGFKTAKQFIENNIDVLKQHRGIIAISNDIWIKDLFEMNLHEQIIRDPFNNLSLVIY